MAAKTIIQFSGLRRSGNHALIQWILNQFRGSKRLFLNDIHPGLKELYDHVGFMEWFCKNNEWQQVYWLKLLKNKKKELLLYSVEDTQLKYLNSDTLSLCNITENYEAYEKCFRISTVRHPLEFFRSRVFRNLQRSRKIYEDSAEVWLNHAESLAGDRSRVCVVFDIWKKELNYRQQLSQFLGGHHDDSSLNKKAVYGGGSSYEASAKNNFHKSHISNIVKRLIRGEYSIEEIKPRRLRASFGRLVLKSAPTRPHVDEGNVEDTLYKEADKISKSMLTQEMLDLYQQLQLKAWQDLSPNLSKK